MADTCVVGDTHLYVVGVVGHICMQVGEVPRGSCVPGDTVVISHQQVDMARLSHLAKPIHEKKKPVSTWLVYCI